MRAMTVWSMGAVAAAALSLGATGALSATPSVAQCQAQAGPAPALPAPQPLAVLTKKGARRFTVEIAATDASREYGLMCRDRLAADRGMLFEFDQPAVQAFWMKNTLIPLDIVYIGADGRIVSIAADARPLDETPLYSSGPAVAVLELKGGLTAKLGIRPGDQVRTPFFRTR